MRDRILGYVMARDEWPMLGMSVTHALLSGVDEVLVVNHSSTDSTEAGIASLQELFPGRIQILHLTMGEYLQRATTNVISSLVDMSKFDWVYTFDADEFLLFGHSKDLGEILSKQRPETNVVRYQIDQWVTPTNFNWTKVDDYVRINHRASSTQFARLSSEILEQEIIEGNLNYFDVEFLSKVIVRAQYFADLEAGAHSVRRRVSTSEVKIGTDKLVCAHLPLAGVERLAMKSAQGKALIEAGFPTDHGWQAQMLWRLDKDGGLGQFWANHSIQSEGSDQESLSAKPYTVKSMDLASQLNAAVKLMCNVAIGIRTTVLDQSAAIIKFDSNWGHFVPLVNHHLQERDSALLERDSALLDIQNSTSWRVTEPLRKAKNFFIKFKG